MNTKLILIIGVVLLLLGGGYFLSQKETKTTDNVIETEQGTETANTGMSIQELLGTGKTQMCSYSITDDKAVTSEGTVFIANGKMRGDFSVKSSDTTKNYTGSMINDGKHIYSWSSVAKQGMKMAITADMTKQIEDAQLNPGQYMDINKKINYKCDDWNVEESQFTPPKEITFMDFSEQMKQIEGMKKNVDTMKNAPCAACDNLQGTAKDSCKTALQCP